jgi:hypothetical protein
MVAWPSSFEAVSLTALRGVGVLATTHRRILSLVSRPLDASRAHWIVASLWRGSCTETANCIKDGMIGCSGALVHAALLQAPARRPTRTKTPNNASPMAMRPQNNPTVAAGLLEAEVPVPIRHPRVGSGANCGAFLQP